MERTSELIFKNLKKKKRKFMFEDEIVTILK